MVTFEEQFPNINKSINATSWFHTPNHLKEGMWKLLIQKHCLDKAKVKEAFKSCATVWDYEKAKRELGI